VSIHGFACVISDHDDSYHQLLRAVYARKSSEQRAPAVCRGSGGAAVVVRGTGADRGSYVAVYGPLPIDDARPWPWDDGTLSERGGAGSSGSHAGSASEVDGASGYTAYLCRELIRQVDAGLAHLDPANKNDKKKIAALNKDKGALTARLAKTDALLTAIGGQLTEEGARRLILKKLYDLAAGELHRYLNAEKRGLIATGENLWDKYAVSSRELEEQRTETLKTLDGFLRGLGYLGDEPCA